MTRHDYENKMDELRSAVRKGTISDSDAIAAITEAEQAFRPGEDVEGSVNAYWGAFKSAYWTRDLSQSLEMRLMVNLPMYCDADSIDVEEWLIEVWKRFVTPDNFDETCSAFRRYYPTLPVANFR